MSTVEQQVLFTFRISGRCFCLYVRAPIFVEPIEYYLDSVLIFRNVRQK